MNTISLNQVYRYKYIFKFSAKVRTIFIASIIGFSFLTYGQEPLAGTDELGRVLPQNITPISGKAVVMFYFLGQGDPSSPCSRPYLDLTDITTNHPSVLNNFTDPYWGTITMGTSYFWGRPIYDYYKGDDYWVHLKNIQLLTDAGVDILVIDATNATYFGPEANVLMNAMDAVRAQGKTPPKIAFYTNSSSGATMSNIYDKFYKSGAQFSHPDCWYYLNDKPLIIGISSQASGYDYASYFTFRESQWPTELSKTNGWPWIEFTRPQTVYSNSSGQREIVNVSVAQHPYWQLGMGRSAFYGFVGNWGRSYHNNLVGNPSTDTPYGYNVQEQWDYAISQNVPFIFVTGWNEWVVGRYPYFGIDPQQSNFCDLASPEFSRDIEPTFTGELKDNYYMQLVSNIRRYKGVSASSLLSASTNISNMSSWTSVTPSYGDYTGDTQTRNNLGAQSSVAISNYGFETPVIAISPGYVHGPSGGNWTFSGTCGIVTNGGAFFNPDAFECKQAAYLQQTGFFQQTVNFDEAGSIIISFQAAQRPGNTQTFTVYCDSTLIGTYTPSSTSYSLYTTYPFTVTEGNHVIKFIGINPLGGDNTAFIDYINANIVSSYVYTNTTGRNDFSTLKVARDTNNLYFYAKTVANITPNSGSNWMRLYIDLDRNATTGWKGYDYRVTGGNTLQQYLGGAWVNIHTVSYTISGTEMYITIPRSFLGNISDPLNFEFKWSDNMQCDTDPMDWYVNGDVAPGGRFNYIAMSVLGIVNGGFEKPNIETYEYGVTNSGWTFYLPSGIQHNGSVWTTLVAPEGLQTAFLQETGIITKSIEFTKGTYKVGFYAAQRNGNTQVFQVYYDNTLIGTFTPASSTAWNYYSTSSFIATAGAHTIKFVGTKTTDNTAFIDAVDIISLSTGSNTGFESPSTMTYLYSPYTVDWTYNNLSGVQHNGSTWSAPAAPEGAQTAFLQQTGTISQDFTFVEGTYKVGFYAAQRSGQTQAFTVYCDNTQIGTFTPASSSAWTYYSTSSFTVNTGVHIIKFEGATDTSTDNTAFIDAVDIILQTTLSNSSFEAPSTTDFIYGPWTIDWTFDHLSGVQHNGSLWGAPVAPEGVQTAFLQQTGTISQTFTFAAGSYKISFFAAQRSGQSQTINIYIDNNLISSITPTSTSWKYYCSSKFNVTAGLHTIKFAGTTSIETDNTAFIDNVCLVLGGVKSVKSEKKALELNDTIMLYPNPTSNILNIIFSGNNVSVELFSLGGTFVSNTEHNVSPAVIPVIGLKNGIYFARIVNNNKVTIKKFIITK